MTNNYIEFLEETVREQAKMIHMLIGLLKERKEE